MPAYDNLPVPIDDGACNHLSGMALPSLELPSTEQQQAAWRLKHPYPLLSDGNLIFSRASNLPMLVVCEMNLIKRLTLVTIGGRIVKVFYPVFPPDSHVHAVIAYLQAISMRPVQISD